MVKIKNEGVEEASLIKNAKEATDSLHIVEKNKLSITLFNIAEVIISEKKITNQAVNI